MKITSDSPNTPVRAAFRETRWSVVLSAQNLSDANSEQALATLCEQYQDAVYAFIRRRGHGPHDAQDLSQEFFHRFISKEFLSGVDRAKGRFRTFLLTTVQRFLCNEWERSQAQKRGGGTMLLTWDADAAEERFCEEPSHDLTPEKLFDRQWAVALLEKARLDLQSEYERAGKRQVLDVLQAFLVGDADESYADAAIALGLSEGATRVWVHRIRRRYGELLRKPIAETVDSEAAVDEELRSLYAALGG